MYEVSCEGVSTRLSAKVGTQAIQRCILCGFVLKFTILGSILSVPKQRQICLTFKTQNFRYLGKKCFDAKLKYRKQTFPDQTKVTKQLANMKVVHNLWFSKLRYCLQLAARTRTREVEAKNEEMKQLQLTQNRLLRMLYGCTLKDKKSTKELLKI